MPKWKSKKEQTLKTSVNIFQLLKFKRRSVNVSRSLIPRKISVSVFVMRCETTAMSMLVLWDIPLQGGRRAVWTYQTTWTLSYAVQGREIHSNKISLIVTIITNQVSVWWLMVLYFEIWTYGMRLVGQPHFGIDRVHRERSHPLKPFNNSTTCPTCPVEQLLLWRAGLCSLSFGRKCSSFSPHMLTSETSTSSISKAFVDHTCVSGDHSTWLSWLSSWSWS